MKLIWNVKVQTCYSVQFNKLHLLAADWNLKPNFSGVHWSWLRHFFFFRFHKAAATCEQCLPLVVWVIAPCLPLSFKWGSRLYCTTAVCVCVCVRVCVCVCVCLKAQVARLRTKTRLAVVPLMVPVVNAIIPTTMGPKHHTHTHTHIHTHAHY